MTRSTEFIWGIAAFVFTLALTITGGSAKATEQPSTLDDDQRFTSLVAPVDGGPGATETGEIRVERFKLLWSDLEYGAGLEDASDDAVLMRLRAAEFATRSSPATWVLDRQAAALAEAHRRGLTKLEHYLDLYDSLMGLSLYDRARKLHARFPTAGLPTMPEVIGLTEPLSEHQRAVWTTHIDPPRLVARAVEFSRPLLVIVSSPACHYCANAVRDLNESPVLEPLMRDHVLWLAQKTRSDSFRSLARWNDEHPKTPMLFADSAEDWPMMEFDHTPHFYFMRNGEVLQSLVGWVGGEDAMWKIARGFDSIGLLETDQFAEDTFAAAEGQTETRRCPTRDEARKLIAERTPIMTREDLDAHLKQLRAGGDSPLLALSPEARKRLVVSARFGRYGTIGITSGDLKAQLEPYESHEIVSLFGLQYFYAGWIYPVELLSEEDRDIKAMFECTGEYAQAESSL